MDRAARGPAVGVAWRDGRALERRIREAADAAEASRRGLGALGLRALAAALVAVGPRIPVVCEAFGAAPTEAAEALAAATFLAFLLAALAFRRSARAYRTFDALDAFVYDASVLALVYLSGTTSTPLWLLLLPSALDARPASPRRMRRDRAILVATHLVLAAAFAAGGHVVNALVTGLVLVSVVSCEMVTARVVGDGLRMRAERDLLQEELDAATVDRTRERIARELHDGVGADVMALLLRLRRVAGASAERRVERAGSILAELRAVVWMLRPGQGSIGELEKLVLARVREVAPDLRVSSSLDDRARRGRVPSEAALEAAELAPALVRELLRSAKARAITVGLAAGDALELRIDWEGGALAAEALAHRGTLTHVPAADGGSLRVALPLS